jgi:hypothetical protein
VEQRNNSRFCKINAENQGFNTIGRGQHVAKMLDRLQEAYDLKFTMWGKRQHGYDGNRTARSNRFNRYHFCILSSVL